MEAFVNTLKQASLQEDIPSLPDPLDPYRGNSPDKLDLNALHAAEMDVHLNAVGNNFMLYEAHLGIGKDAIQAHALGDSGASHVFRSTEIIDWTPRAKRVYNLKLVKLPNGD